MRRLAFALLLALAASPALAQSVEGNWHCRAGDAPAGLLTIYGGSYTFAANGYGDPSSGSGSINWEEAGPRFVDGPLVSVLAVEYGLIVYGGDIVPMDLISQGNSVLNCMKRLSYSLAAAPAEPFEGELTTPDSGQTIDLSEPPIPMTRPQ